MKLLSFLIPLFASFLSLNADHKAVSVASIYTHLCKQESRSNISAKHALKDGFLSGTMVKTLQGYKFIEQLKKNDVIIGTNDKGEQCTKTVQNIAQTHVEYYIRLKIGNEILDVAPSQKFYLPVEKCWVEAQNLTTSMKLLTNVPVCNTIDSLEKIPQNTHVHEITVDGHTLFVTSFDILAHNSDAIAIAAPLLIGFIEATNPVTAGIGVGIALSTSGTLLYNEYKRLAELQGIKADAKLKSPQQEQLKQCLPARLYYEVRLQGLLKMRQELLTIKRDVEKIGQFFSESASYKLLQLETSELCSNFCLQPTVEQEIALSPEQAQKLCELREFDLTTLEKEIENLQITLTFHVNELIEQRNMLIKEHDILWEKNSALSPKIYYEELTPQQREQQYQIHIQIENCINTIIDKNQELNLIIQYYKNPLNATIIKDSTNIIEILNDQQEIIPGQLQILENERKEVYVHINVYAEKYLRKARINPLPIKEQTRENLRQQKSSDQKKAFEGAQKKRSQFYYPKPPKKDDEEKKKQNFSENNVKIYEKNEKHIFKNDEGHLPDTRENRQSLIDTASDKNNFLGTDKHGNEWYAKTLKNGKQIWVSVRNNLIRNGGLNNSPITFNPETGLCKP